MPNTLQAAVERATLRANALSKLDNGDMIPRKKTAIKGDEMDREYGAKGIEKFLQCLWHDYSEKSSTM